MKNELKEQLEPFFKDIKELIKSTAKGTEAVLRKEIEFTNQAIKSVKEDMIGMEGKLRSEMKDMGKDLRSEMKDMEFRLTNELASKEELKFMESRLSDKIDTRIDDHESKSANIAHKAA